MVGEVLVAKLRLDHVEVLLLLAIEKIMVGEPQPIADDRAIVWRPDASKWDGIANFDNPPVARTHLIEFEALWDANMPDDVRRAAQR